MYLQVSYQLHSNSYSRTMYYMYNVQCTICTYIHSYIYMYILLCIHVCIHSYIATVQYTYVHTYTYVATVCTVYTQLHIYIHSQLASLTITIRIYTQLHIRKKKKYIAMMPYENRAVSSSYQSFLSQLAKCIHFFKIFSQSLWSYGYHDYAYQPSV